MNSIILVGRLVNDPELKYVGESNSPVANFCLAVRRKYKSKDGNYDTDFINIETWDKKAETCAKYLKKGNKIMVNGSLRIEKYLNSNGEHRSIARVRAEIIEFDNTYNQNNKKQYSASEIFEEVTEPLIDNPLGEIQEDELPF